MTEPARKPGISRWIVPVLTALAMSGTTTAVALVPFTEDDVAIGILAAAAFGGGLVLAVANVVKAVVMAVSKWDGLLAFLRRAMLLVKLGLAPFYLMLPVAPQVRGLA